MPRWKYLPQTSEASSLFKTEKARRLEIASAIDAKDCSKNNLYQVKDKSKHQPMLKPKQASERTTTSEVPPAAGKTPEAAARYKRPKWPKARPGKNKKNTHRGNRAKVKSLPQHRDTPTKKKDKKKEQRDEITRETTRPSFAGETVRPSFARETVRPSIARETARPSVARREITRPSVAKEEARTTPFPAVSNLSDVHSQQGGQQGAGARRSARPDPGPLCTDYTFNSKDK
jgi:hypothetical protein